MLDEDARRYLFRFFGYGNPESPLWFIGIEEGGATGKPPVAGSHAAVTLPTGEYFYDPQLPGVNDAERSPLWAKYRNISERAGNGTDYFMSNMAPLARPNIREMLPGVSWPAYRQIVSQERIPALKSLIDHYRPRAVLFHGTSAWRGYAVRETFGLPIRSGQMHRCPNEGLLFSRFLLRGFTNENRDEVVEVLRTKLGDGA